MKAAPKKATKANDFLVFFGQSQRGAVSEDPAHFYIRL